MALSDYRNRLSSSGITKRDRVISRSKYMTDKFSIYNPAFKSVKIDDKPRDLIIISTQVITTKTIEALPNEDFNIGSIVFWNKSHWLITQRDAESDISTRGTIEQCNRQIRWQNPDTLKIHERWCVVDNPYSNSLEVSPDLVESHRQFRIKMPYDSESSLIDLDKRFMLEIIGKRPKTYKTVSIDSMTERYDYDGETRGFLIINVKQDAYNPQKDNADLGICDYVQDVQESDGSDIVAEISYLGTPNIKACLKKRFSPVFKDRITGDVITVTVPFKWQVSMAPEMEQHISFNEESDGSLVIVTSASPDALGAILEISLLDGKDAVIASIISSVVSAI